MTIFVVLAWATAWATPDCTTGILYERLSYGGVLPTNGVIAFEWMPPVHTFRLLDVEAEQEIAFSIEEFGEGNWLGCRSASVTLHETEQAASRVTLTGGERAPRGRSNGLATG